MKYYLLNFYQLIKKQYLLILGMYISLYIILCITTISLTINKTSFNIIIGLPPITSGIQILWILFQLCSHIYIVFTYLTYEKDSSYEYILLRTSKQKIFLKKFVVAITITVILRIIIFLFTYMIFQHIIAFSKKEFVYNILIYIIITIITSLITNIKISSKVNEN